MHQQKKQHFRAIIQTVGIKNLFIHVAMQRYLHLLGPCNAL